jgi:hypothetical protein
VQKESQPLLTFKSQRITTGGHESLTHKLTKVRVARGASVKPSRRSCKEGTDRGRAITVLAFWVSRDWKGRVGSLDS